MPNVVVGVNIIDLIMVEETGLYSRQIETDEGDILQVIDFAVADDKIAQAKVVVIHPLTDEEVEALAEAEDETA